jgi:hypothetical protein
MGTLSMAGSRLRFSFLTFQYLVSWGIINLIISINIFSWVHIAGLQCRSGAVRHVENGAECDVADGATSDSAEHDSVKRHLAPILLAESQEKKTYGENYFLKRSSRDF